MIFSTIFSNILLFIQAIACLANNNSFMSPINSPVLNELEQEKNYTFDITNLQDSYSINDQISFSLSTDDRTVIGKLLALHNVAPSNLKIISGGDSSNTPPTFSWNGNGGSIYFPNDKFYLGFVYNE